MEGGEPSTTPTPSDGGEGQASPPARDMRRRSSSLRLCVVSECTETAYRNGYCPAHLDEFRDGIASTDEEQVVSSSQPASTDSGVSESPRPFPHRPSSKSLQPSHLAQKPKLAKADSERGVTVVSGYLDKTPKRWMLGNLMWKRRWFVLRMEVATLSYYKSPTDEKPTGRVILTGYSVLNVQPGSSSPTSRRSTTIDRDDNKGGGRGEGGSGSSPTMSNDSLQFELYHPKQKHFVLRADSLDEKERWVKALEMVCSANELIVQGSTRSLESLVDEESLSLSEIAKEMRGEKGVRMGEKKYKGKVYQRAFTGADAVDWLLLTRKVKKRVDATRIMQRMINANYVRHVCDDFQFEDTFLLYRFFEDHDPEEARKKSYLNFSKRVRKMVSQSKRRFTEGGFDLDLTYITSHVIAMGFPSEKVEGLFRNPMDEVIRFFAMRHEGNFKLYNLCSERAYDHSKFNYSVERYPFDDHNPPPLKVIGDFCENVSEWLLANPDHVAAIHCKAGKGRTGVMVSAYLIYSGNCPSADVALTFFSLTRTENDKGVTIPSQIRYVHYFEEVLKLGEVPSARKKLKWIKLSGTPRIERCGLYCNVYSNGRKVFSSLWYSEPPITGSNWQACLVIPGRGAHLDDDVKIEFCDQENKDAKLFRFWFHTAFLTNNTLELRREEIDEACKAKNAPLYPDDFKIEVRVEDAHFTRPRLSLFHPPRGPGAQASDRTPDTEAAITEERGSVDSQMG